VAKIGWRSGQNNSLNMNTFCADATDGMMEKTLHAILADAISQKPAACEWRNFKNPAHALMVPEARDVIPANLSAIANMQGGHMVIGVEDARCALWVFKDFNQPDGR